MALTLSTPSAVSRIACTRIGFLTLWRASSSARCRSMKCTSHGPSTLGSITTSSLSPISPTIRVMSSRNQGEFSALTRTQSPVAPKSRARAIWMKPSRASALASIGIASSRFPSTTSTWAASSPTLARTFALCGGTKWIMRSNRAGSSTNGRGAPIASGSRNLRGALIGKSSDKQRCLLKAKSREREPFPPCVSLGPARGKGARAARFQFVLAEAAIVGADHGPNRSIAIRAASTEGSPIALACTASIRARHSCAAMSIAP